MQNNHLPDDHDDMPKLDIRQENTFKKLKMSLENGAVFPESMSENLPPEVEAAFLDSLQNFTHAFDNSKRITIFEKIGKPHFVPENVLNDNELHQEIESVVELLHDHGIQFEVLVENEYDNRDIYKFLTQELPLKEIDDLQIPGMMLCFTYEDFYPNHRYDLIQNTTDFAEQLLNLKQNYYEDEIYENQGVLDLIREFRSQFLRLKFIDFQLLNTLITPEKGTVDFMLSFKSTDILNQKQEETRVGQLGFTFDDGFWQISSFRLPPESKL